MPSYKNIVVLTGAGISAESGISTFRDQNGLWENHRIEDVASPEGFRRHPEMVLNFYNLRRAQLERPEIQPNAAHFALSDFEKRWIAQGGQFTLISQNVDDLHQRAGSQNILSMHGQLRSALCPDCGHRQTWTGPLNLGDLCPECGHQAQLRPDIVWFGEAPYQLEACYQAVAAADLFVSIGTSGQVYPAAGFMDLAYEAGAVTAELNLEKTSPDFDEAIYGPASQVVPLFFGQCGFG